jgi:hypothetical protein
MLFRQFLLPIAGFSGGTAILATNRTQSIIAGLSDHGDKLVHLFIEAGNEVICSRI